MPSFLETQPRGAFALQLQGLQPQMRRFFERRFDPFYNRYLGRLGELQQGGQLSGQGFGGFLEDIDFRQEFGGFSPYLRGERPGLYSPRTRFLNF